MTKKEVYVCDYCGEEFKSIASCNNHENSCTEKLIYDFKTLNKYKKIRCCLNCDYCTSNFDGTFFTCERNKDSRFEVEATCCCNKHEGKMVGIKDE